eukprot:gene17242-20513_t
MEEEADSRILEELRQSQEELKRSQDRVNELELRRTREDLEFTRRRAEGLDAQLRATKQQVADLEAELAQVKTSRAEAVRASVDSTRLRCAERDDSLDLDVAVVTAASGAQAGERLADYLQRECALSARVLSSGRGASEEEVARSTLSARLAAVVVLSRGATADAGCLLAMLSVDEADQCIVLLHDAESCRFPSYDEMPRTQDGRVSAVFDSEAVTYVRMYEELCFRSVLQRLGLDVASMDEALDGALLPKCIDAEAST